MASSLGIGTARVAGNSGVQKLFGVAAAPPCSVSVVPKKARIVAAATANRTGIEHVVKREGEAKDGAVEGQERLDRWMRESVKEIVRNLKEAPLLVQVYPKKSGEAAEAVTTEKNVMVEDWPAVKERWEAGEAPVPEGIIFVEELGGDEAEDGGAERTTRAWGVVVQGKGVGCGPVCYLLKTSRVASGPGSGMGICSTHFCLVRVKDFRETVQSQLKNCWLLQSQWQ
ncbi:hypothetical protein RJT34_00918 [Clitoria ternatea]|uniref:DUF7804 domain-containing protein n=1 Tax=Clitoria ternatea TaxID=43366 RepID=A0AAN9Q312_CLITE